MQRGDMNETDHNCLKIIDRETDYVLGVNSPIQLKPILPSANWLPYVDFYESQRVSDGDTNGCVLFTTQESFDAQMNLLIETGKVPPDALQLLHDLGYFDIGTDGKEHFHT